MQVRNLKPEDWNGSADPVVYVEVLGKKKHTPVKHNVTTCVFDWVLFFNFPKLTREEVEGAAITLKVYDSNAVAKDELIGLYEFDVRSHVTVHTVWHLAHTFAPTPHTDDVCVLQQEP